MNYRLLLTVTLIAALMVVSGCENKTILTKKWDRLTTGSNENIYGIHFIDDDKGWAATWDGNVLSTKDGGKTWESHNIGEYHLEDVYFIDGDDGFVVGSDGCLFRTGDGGETWEDQSLDDSYWLYEIGFWDDDEGVLVGVKSIDSNTLAGALFTSKDGGITWQEVYHDMLGISGLYLRPNGLGWITCQGSVGSTTNGGENWEKNILDDNDIVRGAHFFSSQTGWIVGHDGLLASTTDGGWSWQKKGQLTYENLYSIGFTSLYEGLAVGENGEIFLTTNGGTNWLIDSNFVKSTLRDVEVVEDRILICGDAGTLISVHE